MTKNILLFDADSDSVGVLVRAAALKGHSVRLVTRTDDAFRILNCNFDDIDVVVVDADPGGHAMALVEAINGCEQRPPVIVLTALEEEYIKRIAAIHGAAIYLGKPLTVEKIESILDHLPQERQRRRACSCDAWGHVCEDARSVTVRGSALRSMILPRHE